MRRVVAGLVVLALVLTGVVAALGALDDGGGDGSDDGRPGRPLRTGPDPDPDATVPPDPALARFYEQRLDWEECRGSDECATLEVPVDYADPTGETIRLALLRVPAEDPDERIGSLVVNPGGPGAPGTTYAESAPFVFRDALRSHFDIVGFDPRGTGESSPVDCLTDEEVDDYVAIDAEPADQAEIDALVRTTEEFFAGCVERTDELLGHVTTVEAARDMDVLRAALGQSTLDYFGASYGTKLGATYADLFPERVGHLVLDGAVDVSLGSREVVLGQARGFERALRAYVGYCLESSDSCFLGDSVEEGLATITGLLDDVDAEPLEVDDRELTVGNAFYGLITPLYNRMYWPLLSAALDDALDGDGAALLELSDTYSSRRPDGSYGDNSFEAIYAINCLDDPWAPEPEEIPGQYAAFEEASPTLGRVFAWSLLSCHGIQVTSSEPPRRIRAAGAAPIVVVGTTRDPATPYEWAQALADQLESGVLVSRDGDGHTGYNSENECVDAAVEDYLVDGTVPDDGLSC
ncbi:alpha/beta hydrolase [Nocardioides sp. SYSU D00038]|uniref:alpha/beta hydrolase n=1 Tax=Nocardioides sp. SYSU D00038 TaxID=2812554 RepID=UPI001966D03A|nr:alpha/beta hydrolase [Nocardioides sp. SYSU D00038]